jgi:hypothetical protein
VAKTVRDIWHHAPSGANITPTTVRALVSISDARDLVADSFIPWFQRVVCLALRVSVPGTLWQEALAGLPEQTAKTIKGYVRVMPPSNAAIRAL